MDDLELLRQWLDGGSEDAFRTIVDRHINLVYGTARRLALNSHEAEEITQTVFILLARKAERLSARTVLAGWLYRATGHVAAQLLRSEGRRHRRLETLSAMNPNESESLWEHIQPLLEEAMGRLGQTDRDAVILRFLEGKNLQEVGRALGLNEDAARKRIQRAVDKLRMYFAKRGMATTPGLLLTTLSTKALAAAPAGLATSVTAVALSNGAILVTSTSTLAKGILTVMTWTKTKTAMVAAVALMLGGVTTFILSRKMSSSGPETSAANSVPIVANDEGRLGGPGNRLPDWRGALAQARSPQEKKQIENIWCVDNLKQVGGAAHEWALRHETQFPGDFFVLKSQIAPRYFACPSDSTKTEAIKWSATTLGNVSYVLVSPEIKDARPNRVIVRCPIHGHVALSDGSVLQGNLVATRRLSPDNLLQ
jgi:RNA polymerase sigma factor (sigma-70 family)